MDVGGGDDDGDKQEDSCIDDLIYSANFPAMRRQAIDLANVQIAGHANKVTYIQAGELWFAALCICSTAWLTVFVYALLYHHVLYRKRCMYEQVLFSQDTIRIIGLGHDENGEENHDDETNVERKYAAARVAVERIMPTWYCLAALSCALLLCLHCLVRGLHSYENELQDRTLFTTVQVACSTFAWVASTAVVLIYRGCSSAFPACTMRLSWVGYFILYELQCESVLSLHVVTSLLVIDDILVSVAIASYDAGSQEGTSLTDLLYIWQGLFVLYVTAFVVFDFWFNGDEAAIMPYIVMVIVLCEIPARNYKSMGKDPAYLGTSLIGLAVLICLTARVVFSWARKGRERLPQLQFKYA
jgi:hypothetical protein